MRVGWKWKLSVFQCRARERAFSKGDNAITIHLKTEEPTVNHLAKKYSFNCFYCMYGKCWL